MAAPDRLRIPYEPDPDSRFEYIGKFKDGRQFMTFVTGAFPGPDHYPDTTGDWQSTKRWIAVMHKFDAEGNHMGTDTRLGGFSSEDGEIVSEKAWTGLGEMLGQEEVEFCDIYIKPFFVEIDDVQHELVYESTIDEDDGSVEEHVMLWPNDIMFHPPWDSGEYSS